MPIWHRHRNEPVKSSDLRLVVGLGNPGPRYAETRHNLGYMVVQELAQRGGAAFRSSRQRADVSRIDVEGMPLLLALPLTYMNESGNAVSHLVSYYKIPLGRLIVIADDMDLPFGTLRVRPNGSSAGNRGLRSVITSLGSEEFARLRVGIGRPSGNAVSHVLERFSPEERKHLPGVIRAAADAALVALRDGVPVAMNDFNRNWIGPE